jgi:hypothetical protein
MKTFDTARIKDIAEEFTSKAILAALSTLCIRFFMAYMTASVWFYILTANAFFTCIYARKRIVKRIAHHRKFAVFPGGSRHRSIIGERPVCSRWAFPGRPWQAHLKN